VREVVLCVMSL